MNEKKRTRENGKERMRMNKWKLRKRKWRNDWHDAENEEDLKSEKRGNERHYNEEGGK